MTVIKKICRCGKKFSPKFPTEKFCSNKCAGDSGERAKVNEKGQVG